MKFYYILLIFLLSTTVEANRAEEEKFVQEFQSYMQDGNYNKAIVLAKKIIVYTEKKPSSEEREVTLSGMYLKLSELHLHLHEKEKALIYLERLAKVENRYIYTPHKQHLLSLYTSLSKKATASLLFQKALLFQKKAFELSQELNGENNTVTLTLGLGLGNIYYELGQYEHAYKISKALYKYAVKLYGEKNTEVMKGAMNLGVYLMYLGRYDEAIDIQLQTVNNAKKVIEENNVLASMYNTIALTYIYAGAYKDAEAYLTKAISIKKELHSKDESLIKIYNHRAFLYQELGNGMKALKYYKKAIDIASEIGLKDKKTLMATYSNMASVYVDINNSKKALTYYEKALSYASTEHANSAYIYSGLGSLYLLEGKNSKSLGSFQNAIRLKKKYLGVNHPSFATTYLKISTLYLQMKEYKNALKYEKKAMSILNLQKREHSFLKQSLYVNMANTYTLLGDVEQGYAYIEKAFTKFLTMKENVALWTDQKEKGYFKLSHKDLLHSYFYITYLYVQGVSVQKKEEVLKKLFKNWVGIKRAIFEEADNFRLLAKKSSEIKVKQSVKQWFSDQRALARMYQYNAMSAEMESREEQQIVLLTNRISLNERFLSQKLRENNVIWKKKKIDSHQLSKKLQAHTLYMDFVKSAETYYLFTLNSQQHIDLNRFSRKETVEIDKEIVALHEKIEKISKKEQFADIQQAYTQYGKLYDLLIANIDISKYDDLIISPDGKIDLLPFEALYDRKKKKFLLQKKNIRYVSSANELFLEIDTKRKDIVIFADPNFDASVNHNGGKSGKIDPEVVRSDFSKLPGTKKEAFAIKNIFPESKLYIEENATEENLLNVDSPAILHIATHGFF